MIESNDICLSCMECCKWSGFVVTPIGGETIEQLVQYYTWRGCEVKKISGNQIFLITPLKCRHLSTFGCSIYHTRPIWCRNYDGRNDPALADKCKLTFVKEK